MHKLLERHLSLPCELDSTGWKAAQKEDRIVALPGQPPVDFAMYGGYVTVNKEAGRAHYYYFVEAAEEAEKKPLMFWFNGGETNYSSTDNSKSCLSKKIRPLISGSDRIIYSLPFI